MKLPLTLTRNKLVSEKKMRWKELTKIAVSGSRGFEEPDLAAAYMDRYIRRNFESIEDVVILTGGGLKGADRGVDDAIDRWCNRMGYMHFIFYARWAEFDRAAGVIRNQHMIDIAQEFFAFWDGKSPGTLDAIKRARVKGIPVKVLRVEKLRRILGIEPPAKLIVPNGVNPRMVRKFLKKETLSDIVRAADIPNLLGKKKRIKPYPKEKLL